MAWLIWGGAQMSLSLKVRVLRGASLVLYLSIAAVLLLLALPCSASAAESESEVIAALSEARSVQKVMSLALVASVSGLVGCAYATLRLLSGVIEKNTAALTRCEDRNRGPLGGRP